MGWSIGYDPNWKRDIGYGVPALCDHPECAEEIDRGLSYVCGGEPMGGEAGCGLYFCGNHRVDLRHGQWVCGRCKSELGPYDARPDVLEWVNHKLTDPSWADWRNTSPAQVVALRARLAELQATQ